MGLAAKAGGHMLRNLGFHVGPKVVLQQPFLSARNTLVTREKRSMRVMYNFI
jgi:hypothetical protein